MKSQKFSIFCNKLLRKVKKIDNVFISKLIANRCYTWIKQNYLAKSRTKLFMSFSYYHIIFTRFEIAEEAIVHLMGETNN